MSTSADETWTAANQASLVAGFDRVRRLLGGHAEDVQQSSETPPVPGGSALERLGDLFGLSPFERELLLLCAGVEMDARLAQACAEAQGRPGATFVTFGLALGALAEPHWSAITPVRPLRRWRLIELVDDAQLTSARLRIDERVLHFLAGVNYLDIRLQPLLRPVSEPALMAGAHVTTVERIIAELESEHASPPVLQLDGDDHMGQEDIAAAVATRLGLRLFALSAIDIPATLHELDVLAVLWQREMHLLDAALLIAGNQPAEPLQRFVQHVEGLVFISAPDAVPLDRGGGRYRVNKPASSDQKRLWAQALEADPARINGQLDGVAAQFRLSARHIDSIGRDLGPVGATDPDTVWQACRDLGSARIDELAQRIEPAAGWSDLVLPAAQMDILHQIAAHLRHRLKVYEEWGFARRGARGLGIGALFTGESGTGKTMAAEVLANELQLDLYRVDLSAVVSKYIGETEKNLRRVFDAAEESGVVLLFDEADALFGKRSEVKDSHDRYANIEVSYLLQRMEAYRGLAVLTTNHKAALDPAFQRRLRFIVAFPFPDQAQRESIWRGVFPSSVPTHGLDYAKLARLDVTGGNIRNIALNAAFIAAETGGPVNMAALLRAARGEAAKRERPFTDAETRGWV